MIDRDKAVALMGGNASLADKLIAAFKAEVEEHISKLKRALESAAWSELSNQAHMIKTQAGYLGLDDLVNASHELEYATKSQVDAESASGLVSRVTGLLLLIES